MTWRIDWSGVVTPDIVDSIAAFAGVDDSYSGEVAAAHLTRIAAATGGWPTTDRIPSARQVRNHLVRLVSEAASHALRPRAAATDGYSTEPLTGGLVKIQREPRIDVNAASRAELRSVFSSAIANAIVEQRTQRPYRNVDDLVDRVDGLGPRRAAAVAGRLGFSHAPVPLVHAAGDLAADLRRIVDLETGATRGEQFIAALDRIARAAESNRHPTVTYRTPRSFAAPSIPSGIPADRCMVLAGRRYYSFMLRTLQQARASIDIAMFHIAMPGETHPTRRLIDALIRAHNRGVTVRVLVDRDRKKDPYRSQVINATAIQTLLSSGVRVRVDAPNKLLHSKFAIVDRKVSIVGSHNWSAGSFFSFDDLSVAVESLDFARQMNGRFETLWRRGENARRGRPTTPR